MRNPALVLVSALLLLAWAPRASANVTVVNRDTGGLVWLNFTGQVLDVAGYTLQSPSGGFRPANWLSISEHYDADSGGSLDPNNVWTVLGGGSPFDLSEVTQGTTSLGEGGLMDLGTPWMPGHLEDVTFEYLDAGLDEVLSGSVLFVGSLPGDFSGNGFVDQGDLDLVLSNWGQSADGIPLGWIQDFPQEVVDQPELDSVLVNWGVLGHTAPRAVTAAGQGASIPEPSAILLSLAAMLAGVPLLTRASQTRQCSST